MGNAEQALKHPKNARKGNLLPFSSYPPEVRAHVKSGFTKEDKSAWIDRTHGELLDLATSIEEDRDGKSRPATFEDYEATFGESAIAINNPIIEDLLEEARNPG